MPSDLTAAAIVEYVRYDLPAGRRAAFEAAYARAGGILAASPHCLGWELRRSVEEPGHYVVRIEWDSLAGHVRGFRESAPDPDLLRRAERLRRVPPGDGTLRSRERSAFKCPEPVTGYLTRLPRNISVQWLWRPTG